MKICVLGLDCAVPEIVFGDERMVNLRRLMDLGLYGRLESVVPPTAIPAWMSLCTSQDPGSLGIYGLRNRADHSYRTFGTVRSDSIKAPALWDQLARESKKSILVGVPPNYPPRQINGISIGCSLTPDPASDDFIYPSSLKAKLMELVEGYPVDVKNFRTDRKDWLKEEIFRMSEKQWKVVRYLASEHEWDYFHFVDIGSDRMHRGFWNQFDEKHARFEPGTPYQDAIQDYYLWLDEQIGSVIELLDNETIVLVVSAQGAQRFDAGTAINQWLIREGLLVLHEQPQTPPPLEKLSVDWSRTRVWSELGGGAQLFFNVQGREPQGLIRAAEYESFQSQTKARLQASLDQGLKPAVFKPQEIYRAVRNVAPDLIVRFGNDAQYGIFILAAPNCPLSGEYEGAQLLDIAPTMLDLAGYEIPENMQGRSLVAGMEKKKNPVDGSGDDEKVVHDRLAGLGYV